MDVPMKKLMLLPILVALAGCAADAVQVVETQPAYCPSPPAIPVNAQGLVLVPPIVRDNAVDWESAFAYRMQFSLASPARLAGKPAVTAQQLAQLEMVANSFQRNIRFQTLPAFGTLSMRQGSEALRQSLGIGPGVSDAQVIGALLRTECALWAGDRPGARTALAQVAQAPDALDLIAPPGGNAPPRIPNATAAAAAQAAPAIRRQGDTDGRFLRFGGIGFGF
jgi:hypothetical protein